ncbi:hypothetical protein Asi02nite_72040 [Asanoa siamensis]|uniref:Uncharacterized protein n=1 Tax=Asanoa siamensis TaxID=926357 RepID=A0ABQ4D2B7_9ACTN|nr:hypothetical protein Asi02nite_72040 [Asanoa siamensis]
MQMYVIANIATTQSARKRSAGQLATAAKSWRDPREANRAVWAEVNQVPGGSRRRYVAVAIEYLDGIDVSANTMDTNRPGGEHYGQLRRTG